ncbi:MAG: phosphoadenosine phosphosulfate reductase family protein [Inconstantimicrobium porci]|uniref:phosphoadenosine phosphosulfate reductase family protein n=1 Tax=Inconstantimicrobium porci TaxID=2652291 RepID=UPI002A90E6F3|nr:phosphoadenosine phosphosulfate reductase family protein [Inconstantimicrobium porci]MDY5910473.1 phosphoadenosine phosphosulfate reductase family protein [Inconstantimicrobium porci]
MNKDKVQIAIERLQQFEPKDGHGYYVAISGGKDSDVIAKLVEMAGVKYELHHNHTTADAPQTVRYIREQYPTCIIEYPQKSLWQLIGEQGVPPTRLMRYCCKELKEHGGEGRTKVLGVRWQESSGRKNNRKMIELCYKNATTTINPIVDWRESEVWEFHREYELPHNPLYDLGYKRVGCIGCPQKGTKAMLEDFNRFPKYKVMYLEAFKKMLEVRKKKGLETSWTTPEEVFNWWINL